MNRLILLSIICSLVATINTYAESPMSVPITPNMAVPGATENGTQTAPKTPLRSTMPIISPAPKCPHPKTQCTRYQRTICCPNANSPYATECSGDGINPYCAEKVREQCDPPKVKCEGFENNKGKIICCDEGSTCSITTEGNPECHSGPSCEKGKYRCESSRESICCREGSEFCAQSEDGSPNCKSLPNCPPPKTYCGASTSSPACCSSDQSCTRDSNNKPICIASNCSDGKVCGSQCCPKTATCSVPANSTDFDEYNQCSGDEECSPGRKKIKGPNGTFICCLKSERACAYQRGPNSPIYCCIP